MKNKIIYWKLEYSVETTYLIEFFLIIDSTNILYEGFYKFYLCPNLKIYNTYHFIFYFLFFTEITIKQRNL